MSIKAYTDIIINNDQFYINTLPYKESSALETLKRIEEVMQRGLKYSTHLQDSFSKLSEQELWAKLRERSESIRDGYLKKSIPIPGFKRFFGSVAKKEETIKTLYGHIEVLALPPPSLPLPNELTQRIFQFLPTKDLRKVAQVNKEGESHANRVEILRAQEYGYEGQSSFEAKRHLNNLFQAVDSLVKGKHIPKKCIIHQRKWLFFRYVDAEATLRTIMQHLSSGKDPDLKRGISNLLHPCVRDSESEFLKFLLKYGADPNVRDESGETPLHKAANNRKALLQLLLNYGADPNSTDKYGNSPLHYCSSCGDDTIAALLIEKGADVNHQNHIGDSPLHLASAYAGDYNAVQILIKNKAVINARNHRGKTPLHKAQYHEEIVDLLLKNGANPNIADNDGNSPLFSLCGGSFAYWSTKAAKLLIANGAHVNHHNNNGDTPLHKAAKGHNEMIKLLFDNGALINARDLGGDTPLLKASMMSAFTYNDNYAREKTVELLLDLGADPNIANHLDQTPICHSTITPNIVELLVKSGANVNHQTNRGRDSALHYAARGGKIELIKALLKHGANRDLLNAQGKTPLQLSKNSKVKKILKAPR
jgi:ankyrin repeat protein